MDDIHAAGVAYRSEWTGGCIVVWSQSSTASRMASAGSITDELLAGGEQKDGAKLTLVAVVNIGSKTWSSLLSCTAGGGLLVVVKRALAVDLLSSATNSALRFRLLSRNKASAPPVWRCIFLVDDKAMRLAAFQCLGLQLISSTKQI